MTGGKVGRTKLEASLVCRSVLKHEYRTIDGQTKLKESSNK